MDFQGGDGAGGYTNNESGNFGSPHQGTSSQKQSRRPYDEQTLIPITIRMALRSYPDSSGGDSNLVLEDGRKLASVKIVGATRSVNDNSTNILYELEDGTGLIEVKQWLNDNDCSAVQEIRQQTLKEHQYLKVIGNIKEYEGKKIIFANSIRPISTGNEITHHLLEVLYSAERFKRADNLSLTPAIGGSQLQIPQQTYAGTGNPLKEAVLAVFKNSLQSEAGLHIMECVTALNGTYQEPDIRNMIESLSEEGHIYSTISDDHFQLAQ